MLDNPNELLYRIRTGDEDALKEVINEYAVTIEIIAKLCIKHNQQYRVYFDDLIEEGYAGLMTAMDSYREDLPASFNTYASLLIRRKMWNALRKHLANEEFEPHNLAYYDKYESVDYIVCRDSGADPVYQCRYNEALVKLHDAMDNTMNEEEKEICRGLMYGESRQELIDRLGISPKAYDGKLRRVRSKAREAVSDMDELSA